jgi:hypothetical protein
VDSGQLAVATVKRRGKANAPESRMTGVADHAICRSAGEPGQPQFCCPDLGREQCACFLTGRPLRVDIRRELRKVSFSAVLTRFCDNQVRVRRYARERELYSARSAPSANVKSAVRPLCGYPPIAIAPDDETAAQACYTPGSNN